MHEIPATANTVQMELFALAFHNNKIRAFNTWTRPRLSSYFNQM